MVKRELASNFDVGADASRVKRRKDVRSEAPATNAAVDEADTNDAGGSSDHEQTGDVVVENMPVMSLEEVREEGLRVLQTLKDAVDKVGRPIAHDFLRLPSKRQFPDYYQIIKRPIALEDIKIRLEEYAFASIEALRQEFDTCFRNAKKYNMRESVIWKDAKALHKLANKEIDKVIRSKRGTEENGEGEEGSDKDGGKKKKEKGVNIYRLMKNRLQKLASKTDENSRLMAADFMDLPSKKKWGVYYKIIKKPICIEDIFKRIKRKEYVVIQDFINDVDLVFANAMQFNEEHSPIWEDAVTLKAYFHQLMTDLPSKYNMHGADEETSTTPEVAPSKIVLKLPHHQTTHSTQTTGANEEKSQNADVSSAAGTVRLRVPVIGGSTTIAAASTTVPAENSITANVTPESTTVAKKPKVKQSPVVAPSTLPSQAPSPVPLIAMPTPKPAKPVIAALTPKTPMANHMTTFPGASTTALPQYAYGTSHITPSQNYYAATAQRQQHTILTSTATAASPAPSRTTSATPVPPYQQQQHVGAALSITTSTAVQAVAVSQHAYAQATIPPSASHAPTPAPSISDAGIHSVQLEMQPAERRLKLDTGAGVRSWCLRLAGPGERKLIVRAVRFSMSDVEGGEEGDGSEAEEQHSQQQQSEQVEDAIEATKKKRGRGRPPKKVVALTKSPEKPAPQGAALSIGPKQIGLRSKPKNAVAFTTEDVLVRFNGQIVESKSSPKTVPAQLSGDDSALDSELELEQDKGEHQSNEVEGEWAVDVVGSSGRHMLEVGRKGNSVFWQVYVYA